MESKPTNPLPDEETEADKMFQNAGEKGTKHADPDECSAYHRIAEAGHAHAMVCHSTKEWARNDDGDGIREVHCNTLEDIWTGLRNFLRSFQGVHKKYLAAYVAMFEWSYNLKRVTADFLRTLMIKHFTYLPT